MIPGKNKTILLVDDEILISTVESMKIKGFGYEVITAASGMEALNEIKKNEKIDLVLMDIDLGRGMNGSETARHILQIRTLPIVFLTAFSGKDHVDQVKQITRYGYLSKNSSDFVLQSSIEMALGLFEAHEIVKRNEERYRKILNTAMDGFWQIDLNGRIKTVNQIWCELSGYSREEMLNLSISDIDIQQTPQEIQLGIERIVREGKDRFETKQRLKSGQIIDVEVNAVFAPEDHGQIYAFLRNITDSKRVEAELKKRLEIETLVVELSTAFVNVEYQKIDFIIGIALKRIALHCQARRCSVFRLSPDQQTISLTHDWCSSLPDPSHHSLKYLPLKSLEYFTQKILNRQIIKISSGRIHTSTVTVAVMAEADDVEVELNPKDIRIDTYAASGPGGQHVNKTQSAIRITHNPTGIVVTCQDEKSQHKNRDKAMKVLKARLYENEKNKVENSQAQDRKSQVGTGERSEKIRTYNFPQSRVTDHRVNEKNFNIEMILDGNVDEMIRMLTELHNKNLIEEKLKQISA